MLIISDMDKYQEVVNKVKEEGKWEDHYANEQAREKVKGLKFNLEYLHLYGGIEDPAKFKVYLYANSGDWKYFDVTWMVRIGSTCEYKHFMTGGLVYHDNYGWSVNT